jgi:hypothetical protein
MTPRQFAFLAAGFVITLNLTACSSSHPYPESWPKTVKGELVGKCPSIAGTYWNLGVTEPAEAPVHTLAELLGLGGADYVVIDQTPDTVSVSAWLSDTCAETASFTRLSITSEDAWEDWDLSLPQWFECPMDLLSGRQFSFTHLSGAQVWGFSVEFSSVSKTADGSLVIKLQSGGGALLGPLPVGQVDHAWYKFKPVE